MSTVEELMDRYGTTFAAEAGIAVADEPAALYQVFVLANIQAKPIGASVAAAAAKGLFAAGIDTPQAMVDAPRRKLIQIFGDHGYARYDESTATRLKDGAEKLLAEYGGDLRELHAAAESLSDLRKKLQEYPGFGPAGVDIFLREVQGVWTDIAPVFDRKAIDGAKKAGLPTAAKELAGNVGTAQLPRLAAALVRCALDKSGKKNTPGRDKSDEDKHHEEKHDEDKRNGDEKKERK